MLLLQGHNEPCNIIHVAEAVAGAKSITVQELVGSCYANSLNLCGWKD